MFATFSTDGIDLQLLRKQQMRLGLMQAARKVFSRQDNLRQLLSLTTAAWDMSASGGQATPEEGGNSPSPAEELGALDRYTLLQQLMCAATQPSPVKALFTRQELEVSQSLLKSNNKIKMRLGFWLGLEVGWLY